LRRKKGKEIGMNVGLRSEILKIICPKKFETSLKKIENRRN